MKNTFFLKIKFTAIVRTQRRVAPTRVEPYRQVRSKQHIVQQNIEIKPKANGRVFNQPKYLHL